MGYGVKADERAIRDRFAAGRFPVCIAVTPLGDSDSDKTGMNLFKTCAIGHWLTLVRMLS